MKKALLQLNMAVVLWGFTGVLGKAIALDAPVLVWYRMLLTAVFMGVILMYRKEWTRIQGKDLIPLAVIGGLMGIHWVAFYASIKFSNASIALVCLSTASVFTSLLDPYINKGKRDPIEVLLGLLALAGVYLIYNFQAQYAKGIFFGVTAALLSTVFTVLNKRIAHKYTARTMVFYEMSTGWVFISIILAVVILTGSEGFLISPEFGNTTLAYLPPTSLDWLWLIIISLCCTVWAQSLALNALKKLSSFTVTLSVNLEPVYGVILAFIFFHENKHLNWSFFAGMGLICLSVLLQMGRLLKPGHSPGFIEEKGGID